jgi:hypothetical protein
LARPFFQPCSAVFAAFLANTPDPTHSSLPSTLILPGQAYVPFLAFSVRSRRAGPSPLRSASARRRGRGTCPRPAPRAPSSPRPAGPGRVSLYKLAGWAAEAPVPAPLLAPTLRTCWSQLDASRDSSTGGARTGPFARARLGPLRRLPARVTCHNQWGGRGGDIVLRSRFLSAAAVTVVGCSGGGDVADGGSLPPLSSWTALGAATSANPYTIPCGINRCRCRRLKLPAELFVSRLRESADRVESRLVTERSI